MAAEAWSWARNFVPKMPSHLAEKSVPPKSFVPRVAFGLPTAPLRSPSNEPGSPKAETATVCDSPSRNVSLPE